MLCCGVTWRQAYEAALSLVRQRLGVIRTVADELCTRPNATVEGSFVVDLLKVPRLPSLSPSSTPPNIHTRIRTRARTHTHTHTQTHTHAHTHTHRASDALFSQSQTNTVTHV
jgi:hypothetical protein